MPDYDPKNIPTLDDIIEDDDLNGAELDSSDSDKADLNVDLNTGVNTGAIRTEPEGLAEESNLDLFLDEATEQQEKYSESASDKNEHDTNSSPVVDVAPSKTLKIALDPVELESIVENVINTLLPDLEQQLRTRLRETLEDKLCEEVNTLLESETSQDNNTSNS